MSLHDIDVENMRRLTGRDCNALLKPGPVLEYELLLANECLVPTVQTFIDTVLLGRQEAFCGSAKRQTVRIQVSGVAELLRPIENPVVQFCLVADEPVLAVQYTLHCLRDLSFLSLPFDCEQFRCSEGRTSQVAQGSWSQWLRAFETNIAPPEMELLVRACDNKVDDVPTASARKTVPLYAQLCRDAHKRSVLQKSWPRILAIFPELTERLDIDDLR